jgi:hypothetical protein
LVIMDDREVIKMAVFKLGEAASRVRALATTAQASGVQRLLAAVAQVLAAQQEGLRVALDSDLSEPGEEPRTQAAPPRRRARPGIAQPSGLRLATGGRK